MSIKTTKPLEVPYGGSGVTSLTQHGVMLGNAANPFAQVSGLGTATHVLTSNGAGLAPTWQAPASGPAAAGSLTGTTLAANVVSSSLTSVGTLANLTVTNPITGSVTGSAATLTTPRAINGTSFDGSAAITVTAAAGTLTGATLNSTVTASSLTSVGTITSGTWTGTTVAVANGGTGATTLAANGILFGNGTSAIGATAVGTATHILTSNGTGVAPTFQAYDTNFATKYKRVKFTLNIDNSGSTLTTGTRTFDAEFPDGFTVTRVVYERKDGTSVTINISFGGTNLWTSAQVLNGTSATATAITSFNNATVSAAAKGAYNISAVSGAVTELSITVIGTLT